MDRQSMPVAGASTSANETVAAEHHHRGDHGSGHETDHPAYRNVGKARADGRADDDLRHRDHFPRRSGLVQSRGVNERAREQGPREPVRGQPDEPAHHHARRPRMPRAPRCR